MSLDSNSTITEVKPVVAGLSMRMAAHDSEAATIGGPAIYAALGLRSSGLPARLITAVGRDLTNADNDIIQFIDNSARRLTKLLPRPMIVWHSPAVLGDNGKGNLSDDPSLWRVSPTPASDIAARPLVLANGDPDWYQSLLRDAEPSFVFMDAHMAWLRMREKALNACMLKANVITITEAEYKALPLFARSGCTFGVGNKALIIKRGKQGVTILANHETRDLPPPSPTHVRTDVGCGDFLIGLLAGNFLRSAKTRSSALLIDRLSDAYLASLKPLSQLIESNSPRDFIHQSMRNIRSKEESNEPR